ncbi:MAG: 5-oxoprolinase subunit PxpA [Actinomycetota bacterium]
MGCIDLNADLGEEVGDDAAMLSIVTSANVACGGHAGSSETMFRTLSLAAEHGVAVGAHPGYTDREGFGRRVLPMSNDEIAHMVAAQIGALLAVARLVPIDVTHVKAHGALANQAADDRALADTIARTVATIDPGLTVLAISGTEIEHAARAVGLRVVSEVFADRGYLPTGRLIPRGDPGALIHDAGKAAARLLGFVETGEMPVVGAEPIPLAAHSICVHGDSPGAVAMARQIRHDLTTAGHELRSFAGRMLDQPVATVLAPGASSGSGST